MANLAPLTAAQSRALARLISTGVADDVYLAGGVAVAFHLGHRQSIDLDLFSRRPDLDLDKTHARLRDIGASTVGMTDVTLTVRIGRVPVDIVRYPYKIIERLGRGPAGIPVASLADLAAMKLAAIARRGIRRDFWDLYVIVTKGRVTLRSAFDAYRRKFGSSEVDVYQVLRALTWFDEADRDHVMPRGLTRPKWEVIRAWFEREATAELVRRTRKSRR